MHDILTFVTAALQIALLDIVLSGDNVGVIALAIRNLPEQDAKKATVIGIVGAIGCRIFFASILTTIMGIEWLPIRLIGGLLLVKITWDLVNNCGGEEEVHLATNGVSNGLWKAVSSIILADISMSLDNVLAIGGAANGNVLLITFGIALNLPLLFFGSKYVAELMNKYKIVIYIGAGILIHTALAMIVEDQIIAPYVPHILAKVAPWTVALLILGYGFHLVGREKAKSKNANLAA
jgi:YjbE family integral membrane protein